MNLDELKALGHRPIRGDAPCGDPVRDEPEFERLQGEMRKLELPAGEQPDWADVARVSSQILADRGKDLLVGCFLAQALFRLEGYTGLAAGLEAVQGLVEGHWDGLFPERARGRIAAVEWLASRAARETGGRENRASDAPAVGECLRLVGLLGDHMETKAEGSWAAFGELRAALAETQVRIARDLPPEPAPPPPAAGPASTSTAGPASTPTAGPAGGVVSSAGLGGVPSFGPVQSAEDTARAVAAYRGAALGLAGGLRVADPKNPVSYRLLRQAAWLHLRELPPLTEGTTRIPPFQPADLPQKLEAAAAGGQWPGVLETTEGRLGSSILWLDLNRYAHQALEMLGSEYAAAAEAIVQETELLLRRLPGLERLRFANGTPLADAATLAWIRTHATAVDAEGAGAGFVDESAPSGPGDKDDLGDLPKTVAEARTLARSKRVPEALRLLEERASRAGSLRARIRWGLELSRVLHELRAPETACLRLRSLYREADEARVEEWDPALAAEMAKLMLLSLGEVISSGHHPMGDEAEAYREVRARLCRLDPVAALAAEQRR